MMNTARLWEENLVRDHSIDTDASLGVYAFPSPLSTNPAINTNIKRKFVCPRGSGVLSCFSFCVFFFFNPPADG